MAIDASIYSNVQAPQINIPSPLTAAENAMRLSSLGMQQAQMGYQMRQQAAMRQAVAQNTDPNTGELNQAGLLSTLGKTNPMAAMQMKSQFDEQNKKAAEAQTAQLAAAHQQLSLTLPAYQLLLSKPDSVAAKMYPNVIAQLKSMGVDTSNASPVFERGPMEQSVQYGMNTSAGIAQKMAQLNLAKVPAEVNASLYGSRSPNAELTGQYDQQAKPIRSSQMAMQQMIDNYNHPSPQGDASLVLNAFKIKFPNAPDVNSLEELTKSQSASDTWKNMASKALSGGVDQATRDNLMRDAGSTFRANVQSLRGIQQRFQARQKQANVNDPTMTYEPAVDNTFAASQQLQDQIGPYVPPSKRGGIMGGINTMVSNALGLAGGESAQAGTSPPPAPQGMVRMMGPDGKSRLIPAAMKGEAIAAGGKVVK